MNNNTYSTLQRILFSILKVPEESIADMLQNPKGARWDSLTQVSIIMAIESEFSLKLKASDYSRVGSPEALVSLLNEKGF